MYFVTCFSFHRGTNFVWTKLNDTLFCREILLYEPFKLKVRSAERKKAWEMIADNLNGIEDPKFRVTARSVRDRYAYLTARKSTQLQDDQRASGIAVVETELDVLLEEILEKEKEAKLGFEDKKKEADNKEAKDKLSAQEVRKKAMERMSQKKNTNLEEDVSGPIKKKKARRSSQELFEFFEEKMSKTHAYKKEKLQVKLQEQEAIDKREKERNERFDKILQQQNDNIMAMMGQQQQQLQQLQTMFMAQQQQQTQALMAILGNNAKK